MDRIEQAATLFASGQRERALELVLEVLVDRNAIEEEARERLDLRNQSQYGEALSRISQAMEQAGGGELLGRLLHDRGTTLQGARRFEEALAALRAAYLLRREVSDLIGAAYTAFQIPMCRRMAREDPSALREEFQQSAEILQLVLQERQSDIEVGDEGNLRHNLAFCLQFQEQYQEALKEYQRVLDLRALADDMRGEAMTQARIAECLLELGDFEEAGQNAGEALAYFMQIGDQNRIQQVQGTLEKISRGEQATHHNLP